MTLVPFTDCCAMLGIDAKTFRNWLRQANLEWAVHPKDARLKCLTSEQVQQLAIVHARPLALPGLSHPHRLCGRPHSQRRMRQRTPIWLSF